MKYQIRDASPYKYYASIPNIIDDMNLTPLAYRLYGHLKRVAGEGGECWQSTETLAKSCNMSVASISRVKQELLESNPPLIQIEEKPNPNGGRSYHNITILNIWEINHEKYEQVTHRNLVEGEQVTHRNFTSYSQKLKNNPIKNNPDKKNIRGKPRDPNLDHPAIVAYRDIVHLHVPIAWRQDVVDTVKDVEKWKEIVKGWEGKNFRKGSVEGMLDVYRNGWRQNKQANHQEYNYVLPDGV